MSCQLARLTAGELPVEQVSGIVVVDAGVTLQLLDDFLRPHGFMVPLDLGAKDTAMLGGNVASNAGLVCCLLLSMQLSLLLVACSSCYNSCCAHLIMYHCVGQDTAMPGGNVASNAGLDRCLLLSMQRSPLLVACGSCCQTCCAHLMLDTVPLCRLRKQPGGSVTFDANLVRSLLLSM